MALAAPQRAPEPKMISGTVNFDRRVIALPFCKVCWIVPQIVLASRSDYTTIRDYAKEDGDTLILIGPVLQHAD